MGGTNSGSPSLGTASSASSLSLLRKADDLLTVYKRNKDEKSRDEIVSRIQSENWIQSTFATITDSKTSLADLRFLSKLFEKLVDFIITSDPTPVLQDVIKATLAKAKADFYVFLNAISSAEVLYYGASLWLAYSKLLVNTFGAKMPSKEWNDCFTPMEKWFKVSEGQSIVVCLNVWTSFISYAAAKLNTGALREKLLSSFSKPLRSHAVISKLQSPTPIISAYNTLLSAFADKVDDRFEELVICFLRFIVGKPVAVIDHPQNIEEEITKPVNAKEFKLVLEGNSSDYIDYLVDPRPHRVFDGAMTHALPLLCTVLGPIRESKGASKKGKNYTSARKYGTFLAGVLRLIGGIDNDTSANSICSCFAGLAQRIETFEDDEVRRKESRFLFMQLRTWIAESAADVKKLETAVCQLFREADLSVHANTISDWPAKIILETLLDKPSARIGEFLELVPGTLGDGLETDSIVLKRVGEISALVEARLDCFEAQSALKCWSLLAKILTNYLTKTDDINEGSLLKPDFSTTFSFMRLLFKAINHAEEEVDESTLSSCVSAFGHLYEEVQTTVKHEVNCNAATVLFGVLGSVAPPAKTIWSVRMYTAAALHALNFYSFGLEEEKEVCFGSGSEFNVLGDMAPITSFLIPLGEKILSLMDENKEKDPPPPHLYGCYMTVLKMCRIMFCGVSRPNLTEHIKRLLLKADYIANYKIRTLFVTLSDLLLNMYAKMFDIDKARSRDFAQDTYAAIIESVEKKIAGPFDDSFLADCAPLMTALLATRRGRRTKVNQAACSLWKSTFAHAQSLTYTAELRKVLKHLVKKRVINAPGFSMVSGGDTEMTSDTEDASFGTSPFTESQSSSRPRRSKKLGKAEHAEGDCGLCIPSKQEDSVSSQAGKKRSKSISNVADEAGTPKPKTAKKEEIAGVKSEPRPPRLDSKEKTAAASKSPKSEELTPLRCAPTPRTKRRMCMGLLDEDSIDYVPIVSSESAKKMKLTDRQREIFSEKRDRMPFLDEDSQNSAVITHLGSEFDVESSQSTASNVTRKESSPSQKEEPAVVIASEAQKEPMETRARRASLEHPAKTEEPVEESTASPKRRSKMKLNFDQVESCGSSLSDSTTGKPSMKESSAEVQEVERVPDLPLEDSASLTDDVSSSEESVEQSGLGDEKVEDGKQPDSRRSRKKLTPTKYLGLKRREVSKSFDKDQKTPQEATPKKVRQTKKTPLKNMIGTDAEPKQGRQESQENNVEQADDMVALREIDEVLTAKEPGCASLDESLDEKDQEQETVAQTPEKESGTVTQTPEKQNEAPGIIAATPTIPFVQRIAGTPGILKKIDSPSTAERKLRRVHFGETMENAVSDAANAPTDELDKAKITDDLIPASPKATLKRATPRRPFFHLQTSVEQVSKIATVPSINTAASPIKTEADAVVSADDEPIFPRLADCQESIGRIVGKLLPISSTTGALTARKALEAQGVVKICNLASMSRRDVSLLNIKKPRIDTAIRALQQYVRDYMKAEVASPVVQAPEPTAESMEVSEVISTVSMEHKDDSDVAVVVVAVNCEEEVELVERPPTPETAVEEVEDVTEAQNELEPVPVTTAVEEEKKKILENVKEAYRILEEAAAQGAGGNTQLRRAASKTVRALLDLVEWCDEAV